MPEIKNLTYETITTSVRWRLGHELRHQQMFAGAPPLPHAAEMSDEYLVHRMMQHVNQGASLGGFNMRRSLPGIAIEIYNEATDLSAFDSRLLSGDAMALSILAELKNRTVNVNVEEHDCHPSDVASLTTEEFRAQVLDMLQVCYVQYFDFPPFMDMVPISLMTQMITARMKLRHTCMSATLRQIDEECTRRRWEKQDRLESDAKKH